MVPNATSLSFVEDCENELAAAGAELDNNITVNLRKTALSVAEKLLSGCCKAALVPKAPTCPNAASQHRRQQALVPAGTKVCKLATGTGTGKS